MRNMALAGLLALIGCSSGNSSISSQGHCSDDSNCDVGKTCDVSTGTCVEGIGKDNHLSGHVECRLGALDGSDVALGKIFVSGAIDGHRVEMSIAAGCALQGGQVSVALNGKHNEAAASAGLVLPATMAKTPGAFAIDAYALFLTDAHAMLSVQKVVGDHPASSDPYIAYSVAGTGTISQPAEKDGDTLAFDIDVDVAVPVPIRTCIANCVSQADCGTGPGTEGFDYPECTEAWEGGPRSCTVMCAKGTDGKACGALGGHCTIADCHRPACSDLTTTVACETLSTFTDCSTCCDFKNANAGSDNIDLMIQQCGCDASAPCQAECAKACTTSDIAAMNACTNCVLADGAASCRTSVLTKCKGDKACAAFHTCENPCPS